MNKEDILEKLKEAVVQGEAEQAEDLAKKALELQIDPLEAIEKGLSKGMKQVGDAFEKGEIFLVDLILSGEAMKKASDILEVEILKKGLQKTTLGKIVIGTVAGDIHDIGKSIVSSLLKAAGFEVIDLGIDVPTDEFVKAIDEYQPDIIGLSALLTVTALVQGEVIDAIKKNGLRDRVKIIIGGGGASEEHAKKIGADRYGEDAQSAVKIVKEMVGV